MADVKPFSAVRYNRSKVKDAATVVCPPYDVIGPEDTDTYRGQSQYNIINLILPGDNAAGDKYSAAAGQFSEWLRGRVLLKDDSEGIYFLRQTFLFEGRKVMRVGFIALLKLSQERGILPHEHTNLAPKEDRLQLLRKVRANLSPIFILFKDKEKIIERVFNKCVRKGKPLLKIKDREGIESQLWRLEDKELIGLVTRKMRKKPVFIADGHHRFEVACNYLMEQKKADPGLGD
ncbi:MAG: DUF1015 domain-containing protein, partial [Syntrophales bacterium]|nr:DUF1015 domain-containing protein [Syntrophales bacterium]